MSNANPQPASSVLLFALALVSTACDRETDALARGVYAVDAGGRPIEALETGSSLHVAATALSPRTLYEFRLSADGAPASLADAIGFARVMTDSTGAVPAFVLWYESGVVGCSEPRPDGPLVFDSFDEAEERLAGRTLTVSAHPVAADPSGTTPPMELSVGQAEWTYELPIVARRSAMVFPSDSEGCLVNSQHAGDGEVFASGRNFGPGQVLEVSVVPNRRSWHVGDPIVDVTGEGFAPAAERVTVDSAGRFTVRVWGADGQRRGAYDLVAHVPDQDASAVRRVGSLDIISFQAETGFLLSLRYPVGGPTMDLAGRPLPRSPYFEFADAFAETDDPVWAAVDPTYVPVGHPGGTWAAYYVVDHRDVAGWDPGAGGSVALTDVSGGIEIHPVKAGCINGTDVIVWHPPLDLGDYDVVVEFGSTAATGPGDYSTDGQYDDTVDFLDGADQIGFTVARDPYELGSTPIGELSYSEDDFFPTLGGASDVDLRAVVRYPATSAGTGTPAAPGSHPLFLMMHGNHAFCSVLTTGQLYYDALAEVIAGTMSGSEFSSSQHTHESCPQRHPNHMGYMRLLEILASHGVIAVSIDAYDLTGGGTGVWIEERGELFLRHIELWSHLGSPSTFPSYPNLFPGTFTGRVDLSRIAVAGHSRGGEGSVAAYMLDAARPTPFGIDAVASIAPIDFEAYVLPDVPYFVVLPAADGDVQDLDGTRIYDRAGSALPTPDATTKSGIFVYGANHAFFNTVWAADRDESKVPRADYIPAPDQQRIGESYLAAFTRIHLLAETVYEDMLRGRHVFPSIAGYKVYEKHHEADHTKLVSAGPGGLVGGGGATVVADNPYPHQTDAARIGWPSGAATVTFTVPPAQRDASGHEVVAFRAAQTPAPANPATGGQDFQLELVGGGATKAVFVGQFDPIPQPYDSPWGFNFRMMTVVRVPLHSFIMNNAGVTLDDIDTVRMRFLGPTAGEINVDDIEFSR